MSYITGIRFIDTDGNTNAFKNAGGKPRLSCNSYYYDIVDGNIADHTPWSKIGMNEAVGLTELTLGPAYAADYVFPSAPMQMSFRSSNADDDSGGAGALTCTLWYLDTNYVSRTETLTLDGTTWVDTVATDILRVNHFHVTSTGANGKNTGNISIVDKATRAITYGYISAGKNRMRQLVYTVPDDHILYVVQANVYGVCANANKTVTVTWYSSCDCLTGVVYTSGKQFYAVAEATMTANAIASPYEMPKKFLPKTDLKVNAVAGVAASSAEIALSGWLEVSETEGYSSSSSSESDSSES